MYSFDKGRGAGSNRQSRYLPLVSTLDKETGEETESARSTLVTETRRETASTIIASNQSPDVPFDRSINPYRGCEHGCIYCYARPTHAWLDLSPGKDFETILSYKHNAAEKLEEQFRQPGYVPKAITIGANTDAYQPIEQQYALTRQILEVCRAFNHPVSVITKGSLIERDLDLLADLAKDDLAAVAVSVTTLDSVLKRNMEPRAASISARFRVIEKLSTAGVPVTLLFSPVIPGLNDKDLENILKIGATAGAQWASYMLLRLPLEISELFQEWLQHHYPLKAKHVMSLIHQCRGGQVYDSRFGHRMRGTGTFADLVATRFSKACKKEQLNQGERKASNTRLFSVPPVSGDQMRLF